MKCLEVINLRQNFIFAQTQNERNMFKCDDILPKYLWIIYFIHIFNILKIFYGRLLHFYRILHVLFRCLNWINSVIPYLYQMLKPIF